MTETIKMTGAVYNEIKSTIGSLEPEHGGILGSSDRITIDYYYFDVTGKAFSDEYEPDTDTINLLLENEWMPKGIIMLGIVHSHENMFFPSCGDMVYGEMILKSLDTTNIFYLPVVSVNPFEIHMFKIYIVDNKIKAAQCQLKLI